MSAKRGEATIKIRNATIEDLPKIVEIYNSTVPTRISTADTSPVSVEDRLEWFRQHSPENRPLWVMEDDGEVIGWLSLSNFYDGRPAYHATAEIGVYVSEGYRHEGVGRRLVEEAIRRGPQIGLKTLTAGAFAHNEASIKLFEGFGFQRWAHFPKVAELDDIERDLIVMGLRLDEQTLTVRR